MQRYGAHHPSAKARSGSTRGVAILVSWRQMISAPHQHQSIQLQAYILLTKSPITGLNRPLSGMHNS